MNKPIKNISKESMLVFVALISMIIVIVFTSVINAGLNPNKIFSEKNIGNCLINAAITVFGVLCAIPSGTVKTKQRINEDGTPGRYIQEFSEYNEIRQKIEPRRLAFNQWHNQQHLKEQHQKCIDYLLSKGVLQAEEVLNLTIEQVRTLTTSKPLAVNGSEVFFKALTEEQIEACEFVLSGKVIVHKLPDYYFLYIDGKGSKSFYDKAYTESLSEKMMLVSEIAYRVFLCFAVTCIFTGIVIYEPDPGMSTAQYVITTAIITIARIFNVCTSILWGFLLGQELVYKQCYYINGRTQFLKLFDSDTSFKEESIEDLARADFEQNCVEDTVELEEFENGGVSLNVPDNEESNNFLGKTV